MKANETIPVQQAEPRENEKGISTLEYAVMLVLVALAVASFNAGFAASITGMFTRVITALG